MSFEELISVSFSLIPIFLFVFFIYSYFAHDINLFYELYLKG